MFITSSVEIQMRILSAEVEAFAVPVHWDNDIVDLAALRKETEIPICAGQSEITVAGTARLIDAGAIDICNLHPGYTGGITPWLKSADLARRNGLSVANTGEP
jgi:D-galactarolactone cycloisomerase